MCQRAPHVCCRTRDFLSLPSNDQWLAEEDAVSRLAAISAKDHRISVRTSTPSVVAFCHRPPWCYTMMTVREYYDQSWFPGVP
jgi:hypothetical protein